MAGVAGVVGVVGVVGGVVGVGEAGGVGVVGVVGVFGVVLVWLALAPGLVGSWLLDWLAPGSWGDIERCSESSSALGLAGSWLLEWLALGSWTWGDEEGCSAGSSPELAGSSGSWSPGSPGGAGLQLESRPKIIGVIPRPYMAMARLQPCVVPSLDNNERPSPRKRRMSAL